MGNFFHGWRRKTGVVTLIMACMFMGGWIRSLSETDVFTLPIGRLPLGVLISTGGYFSCTWADYSEQQTFPDWNISQNPINLSECGFLFDFSENKRRWCGVNRFTGISIICGTNLVSSPDEITSVDSVASAASPENFDTEGAVGDGPSAADLVDKVEQAVLRLPDAVPAEIGTEDLAQLRAGALESDAESSFTGSILLMGAGTPATVNGISLVASGISIVGINAKPFALWAIPYWSLVVPLTLVSAYLLLTKPRTVKPKQDGNSASSSLQWRPCPEI